MSPLVPFGAWRRRKAMFFFQTSPYLRNAPACRKSSGRFGEIAVLSVFFLFYFSLYVGMRPLSNFSKWACHSPRRCLFRRPPSSAPLSVSSDGYHISLRKKHGLYTNIPSYCGYAFFGTAQNIRAGLSYYCKKDISFSSEMKMFLKNTFSPCFPHFISGKMETRTHFINLP